MNTLFRYCCRISMPFYSVARGRQPGIYLTWPECEAQVKGFKNAIYKKFSTKSEAEQHMVGYGGSTGNSKNKSLGTSGLLKRAADTGESEHIAEPATKKIKTVQMTLYGKHRFPEDDEGFVHVYTDGSCEGNGQKGAIAGLGVYFAEGHALNTSQPVSGRATNNCGEIQAASMAIRLAADNGIQKLCINTDSKFVIDSVTKWLPGWKQRGWKLASGGPVKNIIDFKELDELMLKQNQMQIKWTYVTAHKGILGNERADALAKQGGKLYKQL